MEAQRMRLVRIGVGLVVCAAAAYPVADDVLYWFQARAATPLAAFGLPDIFFALVTVALAMGAIAVLPYAAWQVLAGAADVYPALRLSSRGLFWGVSVLMFFAGVGFCLGITLPYGTRFLMSFESERYQALISVRQFVSFCIILLIGFGVLFELPVLMTLLSFIGVLSAAALVPYRRYAVVVIAIVAAVVTPTPDIVNMMLLAVPLYVLFEMGILGMRMSERRQGRAHRPAAPPPLAV